MKPIAGLYKWNAKLMAVEIGRLNEARTILGQPAYDEQKEIYRVGMLHFLQEIDLYLSGKPKPKTILGCVGTH